MACTAPLGPGATWNLEEETRLVGPTPTTAERETHAMGGRVFPCKNAQPLHGSQLLTYWPGNERHRLQELPLQVRHVNDTPPVMPSCSPSRAAGSGGSTPLRSAADQRPSSRSRKGVVLSSPSPRPSLARCALKTPSYGGSREKVNPRDLFTFSYKFSTDIPMSETQGASIDEYLQNSPRIVGAVFPDQRKEERSTIVPLAAVFLSGRMERAALAHPIPLPVGVAGDRHALRQQVRREGVPPNVPVHATSLLLMEVTDYKLNGLDSNAMPSHLALTVRGLMYPQRQREGKKSLKGHVEMTVGFDLPPVLALVPESIIRGVGETVLRQMAEQMKQDLGTGLAADFKKYRREKLTERRTSP
ncbi:unnamed protein product [Miscanthus lutarioriparius]|uniref:Uncharacterized protein n=1 Tax=Miscanthus lutarioriparius TaxID=422564 RepID=A0A811M6B1_9POAL|nr:unnamed protein product [Miscanthus lutarioriparius]